MDYSQKSVEKGRVLFEKLLGVKKIDEAISSCSLISAKSAYEEFVAEVNEDRGDVFEPRQGSLQASQRGDGCTAASGRSHLKRAVYCAA